MAWSGGTYTRTNGTYSGPNVWSNDKAANVKIVATRHDTHDQDLAAGINNCLTKDGQNSPTANISWGTFKITNLGNGTNAQDAATYAQTVTAVSFDSGTGVVTFSRAAGNLTVDLSAFSPAASLPLAGGTMSGDISINSVDWLLSSATADGSDTSRISIAGGGGIGDTRGASIQLHGNENAGHPGELHLQTGTGANLEAYVQGADVLLYTRSLRVDASATVSDLYLSVAGVSHGGLSATAVQTVLWNDSGTVRVRPNGRTSTAVEVVIGSTGNVTTPGFMIDAAGANVRRVPINEQNGAYTFALSDLGKVVRKTGSSAIAYTINPEGTTAYGDGFIVTVRNANAAGAITLTRGSGVVLRQSGSSTDANVTVAPWATVTLVREALNTWVVL